VCTVLVASNLGIPISTTHCLVAAVVLVDFVRSNHVTEWKVFVNILIAWLVTVPVSGNIGIAVKGRGVRRGGGGGDFVWPCQLLFLY
jgi:phosphate/sulfate permease